jgi:type VI protein secretion system component Hcp
MVSAFLLGIRYTPWNDFAAAPERSAGGEFEMVKLTFLKLEGLRGPSFAPRHIGDIEVWTDHYTFSRQPIRRVGPSDGREMDFNHVLLQKNSDESTLPLRMAYSKDQVFPTGELVIEEISERGQLLRTTAFKMRKIVIDNLEILGHRVTLALKFEDMTVAH